MKTPTLVNAPSQVEPASVGGGSAISLHSRRKRHLAWEEAELSLDGFYARNLESVRKRYPQLSPMQLRVCALAKAMLPSWRIGEILGISTKTVENHFRSTRQKLGLPLGTRMDRHLASTENDAGTREAIASESSAASEIA